MWLIWVLCLEVLLFSIRNDLARPTVHARNLFHTSAAMYDAWSTVNNMGSPYLLGNNVNGFDSEFSSFSNSESTSFNEINAISYSAYRIINHRFSESPGYERIQEKSNALMNLLNLDKDYLDFKAQQTDRKMTQEEINRLKKLSEEGFKDGGDVSLTVIKIPDISESGVESLFKRR